MSVESRFNTTPHSVMRNPEVQHQRHRVRLIGYRCRWIFVFFNLKFSTLSMVRERFKHGQMKGQARESDL
jgi:hypothetical protein